MGVAALLNMAYASDIGDDSSEHGLLLGLGFEAFQKVRAKAALCNAMKARRLVECQSGQRVNRAMPCLSKGYGRGENLKPVCQTR